MSEPTVPSRAAELVDQLSLEEKVSLLSGRDVWRTAPIERLGVPPVKVSDGPNGVRGDSTTGARAVCLPASIALAASFDRALVAELGRLLGRETLRKGAHVLLAPTINMARHPLGGRNFESFGEDPTLTAELAAAYIEGVQDAGVGACAKHFVANDVEDHRLTVSSQIDDATLREVYLAPFEAAVEAGVWTVMAAYPKLNGEHCTENEWLLTTLLREEWGFDGLVMSDWGATHHPTRSLAAGLDLEMPGPARVLGSKLTAAVEAGELPIEVIDRRAANVIDLAIRADRIGKAEEPERSVDLADERELVRRAAADGMVLLTNRPPSAGDPPVLPLAGDIESVAVIGPNAAPGVIQGGGSAQLTPHYSVSPLDGLRAAVPGAIVVHRPGCVADRYVPVVDPARWVERADGEGPLQVEVFDNPDLAGEPAMVRPGRRLAAFYQGGNVNAPEADGWSQRWTGRLPITEAGPHRFGVLAVGRSRVLVDGRLVADNWTAPVPGQAFFAHGSEEVVGQVDLVAGTEVEVTVEWSSDNRIELAGLRFGVQSPVDEDAMVADAVAAAAAAEVAVVVVGLTAEWETESHDRLMYGLPGRQDELVRRVAAANPNTIVVLNAGGPVELPWVDDVAAIIMAWYPGQEFGSALAEVLLGRRDPGGRLPVTFPRVLDDAPTAKIVPGDGTFLHYDEGLFIGHRSYARHGIEPLFPFGHGLSYTEFELGEPAILDGGTAVVTPVTNSGEREGTCVVQLYLCPESPDRPRVLAGFAAATFGPGQVADVAAAIHPHAIRAWNAVEDRWDRLTGNHRLEIATSSTSVAHSLPYLIT